MKILRRTSDKTILVGQTTPTRIVVRNVEKPKALATRYVGYTDDEAIDAVSNALEVVGNAVMERIGNKIVIDVKDTQLPSLSRVAQTGRYADLIDAPGVTDFEKAMSNFKPTIEDEAFRDLLYRNLTASGSSILTRDKSTDKVKITTYVPGTMEGGAVATAATVNWADIMGTFIGADQQVIFNNAGAVGATNNFKFDTTNGKLTISANGVEPNPASPRTVFELFDNSLATSRVRISSGGAISRTVRAGDGVEAGIISDSTPGGSVGLIFGSDASLSWRSDFYKLGSNSASTFASGFAISANQTATTGYGELWRVQGTNRRMGVNNASPAGMVHTTAFASTDKGFVFTGAASHTGNAIEAQNSSGTAFFTVNGNVSGAQQVVTGDQSNSVSWNGRSSNATGWDFMHQPPAGNTMSIGFNLAATSGGSAGTLTGAQFYWYDRQASLYRGTINASGSFVWGTSSTTAGTILRQPGNAITSASFYAGAIGSQTANVLTIGTNATNLSYWDNNYVLNILRPNVAAEPWIRLRGYGGTVITNIGPWSSAVDGHGLNIVSNSTASTSGTAFQHYAAGATPAIGVRFGIGGGSVTAATAWPTASTAYEFGIHNGTSLVSHVQIDGFGTLKTPILAPTSTSALFGGAGVMSFGANNIVYAGNAYYGTSNIRRLTADKVSMIQMYQGEIAFRHAATGTADSAVTTFVPSIYARNDGKVSFGVDIGGATPASQVHVFNTQSTTTPTLIAQAIASQTANNYEGRTSAGAVNFEVGPTGNLRTYAGRQRVVTSIAANTTLDASHDVVFVNANGGNVTVTIPLAASHPGRTYNIIRLDNSANTVTVTRSGSDGFGSEGTSISLAGNSGGAALNSLAIISDGVADWRRFVH